MILAPGVDEPPTRTTRSAPTDRTPQTDPDRLGYRDPRSGYRIVVRRPADEPDLWQRYLDGAVCSYRAYDVESVLNLDEVADGRSSTRFFAALDADDEVVGGMRVQGPYTDADQSHAVVEWAGHPARPQVHDMITERIPFGVVETKTAWVSDTVTGRRELVGCLSRAPVHAASVLGARYALGTSAVHTLALWTASGAVVADQVAATPYPDDRYLTRLVWWDLWELRDTLAADERATIDDEAAQLRRAVPAARVGER